jgi:hypothetical protein
MKVAIISLLSTLFWLADARPAGAATPNKAGPVSSEEARIVDDLKAAKGCFEKECDAVMRGEKPSTLPTSEAYTQFHRALIKVSRAFPLLDHRELPATNRFFKLKLNARGAGIDGFRFKNTTVSAKNLGWIFALEQPSDLTHWYILRVDNVPMEGFNDLFHPKVAYANAPWDGLGKEFKVTIQWLRNGAIEPNAEYLIWFVFRGRKPIDAFIGLDLLPATERYESRSVIEDALGLRARSVEAQAVPPIALSPSAQVQTNTQNHAVRFETESASVFAVQSRFTGTAVVTGNVIKVQVDSGNVSNPVLGKEGDWRTIQEYQALLVTSVPGSWERIGESEVVKVQKDLLFGKQFSLPATNLTIPLRNVGERTNHWLAFSIKHVSANRPAGGYTFSHSKKDLFQDLPVDPAASVTRARQRSAMYEVPPVTAFILDKWDNFPVVKLLPPTNKTDAVFQDFKANDYVVGEFEGRRYTGVRLTLPSWIDGDFEYAFVHVYRSAQEQRTRGAYSWQMTTERGVVPPMGDTDRVYFSELPETLDRYPFTEKGYTGAVKRQFLTPGQMYLFWWSYTRAVVPDMTLAFTIVSPRGRKEFGATRWR